MGEKFLVPLKVRNYHIDSYDHVNNAQYMNLLEEARIQLMENAGCPFEEYFEQGIFIFISDIHIKFKKPAVLGNQLEVYIWLSMLKRAKLSFQQEIRLAGSGELIATANVSCGFVHNGRVIPVPKDFLENMQPYHIPDQV